MRPEETTLIDPDRYAAHGYPHDEWALLRREDPLHWFDRSEGEHFWAVTRHEDIPRVAGSTLYDHRARPQRGAVRA